jgi:hypothetical protein
LGTKRNGTAGVVEKPALPLGVGSVFGDTRESTESVGKDTHLTKKLNEPHIFVMYPVENSIHTAPGSFVQKKSVDFRKMTVECVEC